MTAAAVCACGSTSQRAVLEGRFNRVGLHDFPFAIVRCRDCGLARTDPVPDATQYEPASSGAKGAAKAAVAVLSSAIGRGDQLEAVFERRR